MHSSDPFEPLPVTRRRFLSGCATCAIYASCAGVAAKPAQAAAAAQAPIADKAKIRLVFTHISPEKPTWPYRGYDYEGRKRERTERLRAACPAVEFLPATAQSAEDAEKLLEGDADVDGYLVYMLGIWTNAPRVIAAANRPTLFVDDLYAGSGEFLIANAAAKRSGLKVAGISSSNFDDVVQGVKCFETLKKMRSSVILDVIARDPGQNATAIREIFGTTVRQTPAEEINAAYQDADKQEAAKWANHWVREAERVVEPSREDIENAARLYAGMQALMKANQAQAITIDCLTLLYGGKLPAYPCLGFFQLNNDGLVGACEADLQSTVTMLMMNYLVGRPGYISDPVIDTARNQIIYAHCVSTNRVFGPNGKSNPYYIRSHSENRRGAVVRSLMPLGEMTTTLKLHPVRKEIVLHQGRSVANIDEDKGCRTKLAVEVRDPEKLLREWDRWGWHRVTFYGDWKRQVETMSALLGFNLVVEG